MHIASSSVDSDTVPHKMTQPAYTLTRYTALKDVPLAAAQQILRDHGESTRDRLIAAGGPWFDINDHLNAFWKGFADYTPPNGSYYLAHDTNGRVIGTASLKRISDTTGEMKHLYVEPSARGTGLGMALVRKRIADARAMGLRHLTADTLKCNPELPALYKKIGFDRIDSSDDSYSIHVTPELKDFMYYYRMTL